MATMNCPQCKGQLEQDDFTVLGIAPGGAGVSPALDIICDCPHCASKLNAMVRSDDFIVVGV